MSKSNDTPGLRERKAAQTRIALAQALDQRLDEHPLHEVSVDQIAADAGVSRMTFFNHFSTKEDAVIFTVASLVYRACARADHDGLIGRAALERLFAEYAADVAANPERARRRLSAMFDVNARAGWPTLGRAERALLYPEHDIGDPTSLGTVLMRLIDQAKAAGEIAPTSTTYELGHLVGCVFVAAPTIGRHGHPHDWPRLFAHHLERALGPNPRSNS